MKIQNEYSMQYFEEARCRAQNTILVLIFSHFPTIFYFTIKVKDRKDFAQVIEENFTMTKFDPTDAKYQLTEEFKPDKEETWTHPPEADGWVHAHNYIRKELDLLHDCFDAIGTRGGEFDEWEAQSLQKVFHAHHDFIHMHHTNEDKILAPKLQTRFKYPEKLCDDHDGIIEALSVLSQKINEIKKGDSRKEKVQNILSDFKSYSSNLREHLKEEEDMGLPLLRAYFKPEEYVLITQEILKSAPKV